LGVPSSSYKFGEFELDSARFELRRGLDVVRLERIPMELLVLLLEKDGNVVSRQEIIDRLWGKDVYLDTEHGINTAIRKIRQALRDDPEDPRFVRTVTGKGYRFIAEATGIERQNGNGAVGSLRAESPTAGVSEGDGEARSSAPGTERAAAFSSTAWRRVALVTVLGVCAVAAVAWVVGKSQSRLDPVQIHSIAVLPIDNLSADPAQEYFADGMTDELITMLAKNTSLRVVSRTSVMQYKKAHRPLREIAQELGVDGIVEGSLLRNGSKVHLTVQLIQAPLDVHLWADSYDRDQEGVASLPREVALSIARQVKSTRRQAGSQRAIKAEAHDAYLMGRYYWFSDDPTRGLGYFQKAIELQPDYAAAWSGLADAEGVRAVDGEAPAAEVRERSEAAARKALELDDQLADSHKSMAGVLLFLKWDAESAQQESARAIELDPNNAEAHHLRAYILEALNRKDEALEEQKIATGLDPVTRPWAMSLLLVRLHRFDDAIQEAHMRLGARPGEPLHGVLFQAYHFKGMDQEAGRQIELQREAAGDHDAAVRAHNTIAKGGLRAFFEGILKFDLQQAKKGYLSPYDFAHDYARLGDREQTILWLQRAYQERVPWLIFVQDEPIFDFVHSDSRFQEIVRNMNLAPQSAGRS
jgi:TolB-like protein/DNA-binding winged helix-turn-helix (wHTH) protein